MGGSSASRCDPHTPPRVPHSSSASEGVEGGVAPTVEGDEPTARCGWSPTLSTTPPVSLREESATRGEERGVFVIGERTSEG